MCAKRGAVTTGSRGSRAGDAGGVLRVIVQASAAAARTYYRSADYYAEGQELAGEWGGRGAARLGLGGAVSWAEFDALCENRDPATGRPLTPRTRGTRRVGFDLNFHVPKSVSVLYGLTGDRAILAAFRHAVCETMAELEADAGTRVRRGGGDATRVTGNLIWASFVHTTARPVGGVPDPHLHCHAFVFNATFDAVEGRWKAVEPGAVHRGAPYFEAAFHARLALRLRGLGYEVVRTPKGWELAGVPERVLRAFSRRTAQVEAAAAKLGVTDPRVKDALGAKTREPKRTGLSLPELRAEWWSRLTPEERAAVLNVFGSAVPRAVDPAGAAGRAMAFAVEHCFERASAVPVRRLLAAALRRGVGLVTVEEVTKELSGHGLMVRERGGERWATTRAVLEEEAGLLAFARHGRGTCRPLWRADQAPADDRLGADQWAAVRHVLTSTDRVILLRGAAGTGKTALMRAAVAAVERAGKRVVVLAPSADASRGVLRAEGFADADTVARFLTDPELQRRAERQVVWVDEAGLLGTRTLGLLFRHAEHLGARVVLSGDWRQHAPVERGAALRLLETEAGLVPAEVKQIRRQSGQYREVVRLLSEGRTVEGFDALWALGWVREVSDADRDRTVAAAYVAGLRERNTVLVVSPTHAEGRCATSAIRESLRAAGLLASDERRFVRYESRGLTAAERAQPESYRAGDVVEFHRSAPGFRRGGRYAVTGVGRGSILAAGEGGVPRVLPLRLADRFDVYAADTVTVSVGDRLRITKNGRSADRSRRLYNGALAAVAAFTPGGDIVLDSGAVVGRDFGHLAHGYCVTSHAAQGKTVDRVLVCQSGGSLPASSREQFYVSVSRGRRGATVFTDDAAALRRAVQRTDPRPSATELLKAAGQTVHARSGWVSRRLLALPCRTASIEATALRCERPREVAP